MVAKHYKDADKKDAKFSQPNCFPKSKRLLRSWQFQELSSHKKQWKGTYIRIYYAPAKEHCSRLGISVSKKFGKAHIRVRFKRIIREAFRKTQFSLPLDINVFPRTRALEATSDDIMDDFTHFLREITSVSK